MQTNSFMRILMRWDVLVALAILVATGIAKRNATLMPEHVNIPNPVMPKPNAFDYAVKAGQLLKDKNKIDAAYAYFYSPAELPASTSANKPKKYSTQQLVSLVDENHEALAELNEGNGYRFLTPPARSMSASFPYLHDYRYMARLFALKSVALTRQGKFNEALEADIDAIKLGSDAPHGGGLIHKLVGVACEEVGRKAIITIIDRVSASEAKRTAARMALIDRNETTSAETLTEEKYYTQAILVTAFSSRWQRKMFMQTAYPSVTDDELEQPWESANRSGFQVRASLESGRAVYRDCTNYMDRAIKVMGLPWREYKATPAVPIPNDEFAQVLFPIFSAFRFKQMANLTLNHLLETQLALHAYKLDHGKYPTSLDQLSPGYLSAVPTDPFGDDAPLHYRLIGEKYLLYSVGPDGNDDGGQANVNYNDITNKYSASESEDAVGDIVAGVNY